MKKSFLKLVHNVVLCFGMMFLFSISNYNALQNSNTAISESSSESTNNANDNSSETSDAVDNGNKKADKGKNDINKQEQNSNSESESQSIKKSVEDKKVKISKKKANKQEKKDEETTKQVLLPEISFEDLDLDTSEKVESLKQKDDGDKVLKGAISWGLIFLGIALITYVIISNRKIPSNIDIKTCNKHDTKSKNRKKYYKNIQRRG